MQPGDLATWIGVAAAFVVGAGGVVVGWRGLVVARGAREDAKEANRIAKASLVGDDVSWELWWVSPGVASIESRGHDEPMNARGEVTVDGMTKTFQRREPRLTAGGNISIREPTTVVFPELQLALAAEESRVTGKVERGYVWEEDHEKNHTVSWRVTWETPLGRTMPTDVQSFENQSVLPGTTIRGL